ncbi:MAG: hypothetical protein E7177_06460 [Erysipelotrichaceae bacterium]|nr:hypothetical protein [Erysipelotrichaceae bacterium]
MRIKVISKEEKVKINLVLPTSLIKSKIILNKIKKYSGVDLDINTFKNMYKVLKDYIKENGHFNLVEVITNDGEYIKIRV